MREIGDDYKKEGIMIKLETLPRSVVRAKMPWLSACLNEAVGKGGKWVTLIRGCWLNILSIRTDGHFAVRGSWNDPFHDASWDDHGDCVVVWDRSPARSRRRAKALLESGELVGLREVEDTAISRYRARCAVREGD